MPGPNNPFVAVDSAGFHPIKTCVLRVDGTVGVVGDAAAFVGADLILIDDPVERGTITPRSRFLRSAKTEKSLRVGKRCVEKRCTGGSEGYRMPRSQNLINYSVPQVGLRQPAWVLSSIISSLLLTRAATRFYLR